MAAPQRACAFSRIASNTGARLPGEALITCNTSAVAVCCSSASRCSVDQPRVLDRDHRLIGEGPDEFDLPIGERLDTLARQHDGSDRLTFAQQRDAKRRSSAGLT